MPFRTAPLFLALLALTATPANARRPDPIETATGLPHKQLVEGLAPATQADDITLASPIEATALDVFGPAALTLRPVQCRLAFANAAGKVYDCPRRSAHLRGTLGQLDRAVRARTALWRSADGTRAAALVFYELPPSDGTKDLLRALAKKRFTAVPITPAEWTEKVVIGHADVAEADRLDSAAAAALTAAARSEDYKLLHAVPPPAPDQALVWGELRPEGEVTIQKLDGRTTWHVPLNGYAQAVVAPAGAHTLRLVLLGPSGPREYEQDLGVQLVADHTYVVSQGLDDRPRIEDLGPGVQCERRKRKMLMAAGPGNAWLACVRPAANGAAAP